MAKKIKPEFYIVRFEGYSDLEEPDYEWFLAESEKDARKVLRSMYDGYDLGNLEFYKISDEVLEHDGIRYKLEVTEIKDIQIREYLSEIGAKGGKKSRRELTPEESKRMNDIKRSKAKKNLIEPQKRAK